MPVRGLCRQHEQPLDALLPRQTLHVLEQDVAAPGAAVVGVDRDAGELRHALFQVRVERGAGDRHALTLHDHEAVDLGLEQLARAAHQHARFLQRTDQLEDAADVVERRRVHRLEGLGGDERARALAGEQLAQNDAVGRARKHVDALDPAAAADGAVGQVQQQILGQPRVRDQQVVDLSRGEVEDRPAAPIGQSLALDQRDELVGADRHGHRARDVGRVQVEDLARRRVADRRYQHDRARVEPLADCVGVDAAHLARVLVVHALAHAERLGGDEVAGRDAYARARHRRVREAHREQGLDLDAHGTGRFLHAGERGLVGDAQAVDVADLRAPQVQPLLDLRPRAVDEDEAYAEPVQDRKVVDEFLEGAVRHGLATADDDERAAAVGVDVRGCLAEEIDEGFVLALA